MVRKWYRPKEILQHLRTIKLETGKDLMLLDAGRLLGGPEQMYEREKSTSRGACIAVSSGTVSCARMTTRKSIRAQQSEFTECCALNIV